MYCNPTGNFKKSERTAVQEGRQRIYFLLFDIPKRNPINNKESILKIKLSNP